jgi:putative DNA primase/helicase
MTLTRTALDVLDQTLPAAPKPSPPDESGIGCGPKPDEPGEEQDPPPDDRDLDVIWRVLPEVLRQRIMNPESPTGDRSKTLFYIIKALGKRNLDAEIIGRLLRRYPQGPAGKYANRSDLDTEIRRILAKRSREEEQRLESKRARGDKPVVRLIPGMMSENIDEAEKHLKARDGELYQRGDVIVRPGALVVNTPYGREIKIPGVVPLKTNEMIERFTKAVDFQVFNSKTEDWNSVNCPHWVASIYLERIRRWRLRKLTAVVNAPLLRSDGSILETPGYDEATGILFDPLGVTFPAVPQTPSQEDALVALAYLKGLYKEFPFVSGPHTKEDESDLEHKRISEDEFRDRSASRSVALSLILTMAIRPSLPTAPLHGFSSPYARVGKTKMIKTASVIVGGYEVAGFSPGLDEQEFEKRLGAELLGGASVVLIDNCEQPVSGMLLAQGLSETSVRVRILGLSEQVMIPNTATYAVTGVNLVLLGDTSHRAVRCDLDPQKERPETRTFSTPDPVIRAYRERPKLLVAALTILRAYHLVRGEPLTPPLGSFEPWSRTVRDALVWLGEPDPYLTEKNVHADDPVESRLGAVIQQWHMHLGADKEFSVREVIERAVWRKDHQLAFGADSERSEAPEFREALLLVAGKDGAINSYKLGTWLGKNKDRLVAGWGIVKTKVSDGVQYWQLSCKVIPAAES